MAHRPFYRHTVQSSHWRRSAYGSSTVSFGVRAFITVTNSRWQNERSRSRLRESWNSRAGRQRRHATRHAKHSGVIGECRQPRTTTNPPRSPPCCATGKKVAVTNAKPCSTAAPRKFAQPAAAPLACRRRFSADVAKSDRLRSSQLESRHDEHQGHLLKSPDSPVARGDGARQVSRHTCR